MIQASLKGSSSKNITHHNPSNKNGFLISFKCHGNNSNMLSSLIKTIIPDQKFLVNSCLDHEENL